MRVVRVCRSVMYFFCSVIFDAVDLPFAVWHTEVPKRRTTTSSTVRLIVLKMLSGAFVLRRNEVLSGVSRLLTYEDWVFLVLRIWLDPQWLFINCRTAEAMRTSSADMTASEAVWKFSESEPSIFEVSSTLSLDFLLHSPIFQRCKFEECLYFYKL